MQQARQFLLESATGIKTGGEAASACGVEHAVSPLLLAFFTVL
jgi:hypothetical protein